MNFCPKLDSNNAIFKTFLRRFQLLPQHCPAALHLGFKFIVRYVHYSPSSPFSVYEGAMPFKDEAQAKRYLELRIENAHSIISKFTEESREHYVKYMVRIDDQNDWTVAPTYDALLIRYCPRLLRDLSKHLGKEPKEEANPEPLPTPTSSITELDQLSNKIAQESTKVLVEFDHKFMMQELASASKSRDYINHIESKVSRESGYVEQLLLSENLKQLSEIEANIQRESFAISTKFWSNILSKFGPSKPTFKEKHGLSQQNLTRSCLNIG